MLAPELRMLQQANHNIAYSRSRRWTMRLPLEWKLGAKASAMIRLL